MKSCESSTLAFAGYIMPTPTPKVHESSSAEAQPLFSMHTIWKLRFRQALTASGPIVATLGSGITSGFSAILLPQLALDTSDIKAGPDEFSWIASAAVLPMALGSVIGGYLMEQYGRRFTQLFTCVFSVVGWVLLSFASNLWSIYIGRMLTGLCVGLLGPTSIVYIAETTDPRFRGTVLAGIPLAISGGILCSHVLGTFFTWQLAAALCAILPFVGYILLFPAPESPIWLASKGSVDKAEESFRWLRGYSDSATQEMATVLKRKDSKSTLSKTKFDIEIVKLILDPSFMKPFLVMNAFFFIQQFSGINAVIFYSVSILSDVTSNVNEYLSTFIIDIVRVTMSGVACILLKNISRRFLAVFSATGTAVSLFLLAFSILYLPPQYSWVSLLAIISYTCFISIGIVPLPWIMIGEVFPHSLRELGSGSSSCFAFFAFFCVVKTSPYLISEMGVEGAFTIFGIIALLGAFFLYFYLPETNNKTLQEIEDSLKTRHCTKNESTTEPVISKSPFLQIL